MESIISSFLLVALSETGDKTQLLAFYLAARFKKPWPILAGIFAATVLNHGLASWIGERISHTVPSDWLGYLLGAVFIGFGLWTLKPDELDEQKNVSQTGAFLTTLILFFLAEMGDKTQLATAALGARYQSVLAVTLGTTAGMLAADGPAIFLGERFSGKIRMEWVRAVAAILFFLFGLILIYQSWRGSF